MVFLLQKVICIFFIVILVAGCAEFNGTPPVAAVKPPEPMPLKMEVDAFLEFGANMATMAPSARDETCLALLKSQKAGNASMEVVLRLLSGRLLSESCGESRKILDAVSKLAITDTRLQQMILFQTEALKRSTSALKKSSSECKAKSSSSATEAKVNKDAKDTKDNETKLLREKLEAIRSLERRLDATSDLQQ